MKRRHKAFLKINFMSIVFAAVSFISVTLAWFAYSGLSTAQLEVNVKAWYIELEKDGETVSNDIVISLDDIYPGMQTISEIVKIKNLGDSNAQVSYSITSARILDEAEDNYVINQLTTSDYVEDRLSHYYPFHININLDKRYVLAKTDETSFEVSISWPLDSGNDVKDSEWGTAAYQFQTREQTLKNVDNTYQIRPSIKLVISVKAEQYIETDNSSDIKYNLGDEILYDVVYKTRCSQVSTTCLSTNVIDINNTLIDENVTLLPNISNISSSSVYSNYSSALTSLTNNWNVQFRGLQVTDILKIISNDINNSYLVRNNLSNKVIGNLKYNDRMNFEINNTMTNGGYYTFLNTYSYLASSVCYWTNTENGTKVFSVVSLDNTTSKLYGIEKTETCKVVPVIEALKSDLEKDA